MEDRLAGQNDRQREEKARGKIEMQRGEDEGKLWRRAEEAGRGETKRDSQETAGRTSRKQSINTAIIARRKVET